jgi:hypothetical protein
MGKPFQFTIRQMLFVVALFCIAASLAAVALNGETRDKTAIEMLTVAGAVCGAGIGLVFRRIVIGIVVGTLLVAIPMGILYAIVGGVCP